MTYPLFAYVAEIPIEITIGDFVGRRLADRPWVSMSWKAGKCKWLAAWRCR